VKEKVRMQFLAGLITESQYKQLLEDETTLNRILDKMSDQGKDSLTPEEKAYLDNYSKGKKDLEAPIHYIKLNLPKDINSDKIITLWSSTSGGNEAAFKNLVNELIKLNPQIDPELFLDNDSLFDGLVDNIESGTKKEILPYYFYWLYAHLVSDYTKYSDDEMEKRVEKYDGHLRDDFKNSAMKGQWMVVPTVTDSTRISKPHKKYIDPDFKDYGDILGDLGF
jgi:hypothetical protein